MVGRPRLLFAGLLVATFAVRVYFAATLPLSGDEAYHWEWSRHLAAAYYDHPGMTAWLIRASTCLFGVSELAVRLPAFACLGVAAVAAYALARRVALERGAATPASERAGFLAGALILYVPITAVMSVYMSTDPPLIAFWVLTLLLAHRAVTAGGNADWFACGVALGGALATKFLAALLLPILGLLALVARGACGRVTPSRAGVAMVGLAVPLVPVLWWNAQNGWATFRFNFGVRQTGTQGAKPVEFLIGQLAVLSPGIALFALAAIGWSTRDWLRRRQTGALMLALATLLPLLAFASVSLQRRVGVHWMAAGWLGALIYLAITFSAGEPRWRRAWRWSVGLAVCIAVASPGVTMLPVRWLDFELAWFGEPKRVRVKALKELYGWVELGHRVDEEQAEMRRMRGDGGVFVISNQYGVAAAVAFYSPSHVATHLWSPPRRHGRSYDQWDDFASLRGQDGLLVSKRLHEWSIDKLREHFTEVDEPEELRIVVDDVHVRSFWLVRCRSFDGRHGWRSGGQ